MKKLITLILILALILPAAMSAADTGPVGCWAHYELLNDGAPFMTMIYLADDHMCYYLTQMYHTNEPGFGRKFVGTWEQLTDGSVQAKTGNNTSTTLRFSDDYSVAMDTDTGSIYINISYLYSVV